MTFFRWVVLTFKVAYWHLEILNAFSTAESENRSQRQPRRGQCPWTGCVKLSALYTLTGICCLSSAVRSQSLSQTVADLLAASAGYGGTFHFSG